MDKATLNNIGAPKEPAVMDTVFLRILRQGKQVTLFSYKDNLKTRFYLLDKERTGPVELIYQLYSEVRPLDGIRLENVVETYKNQLMIVIQNAGIFSEQLNWMIRKATFGNKSLTDIVNKINGDTDNSSGQSFHQKAFLHFFVGAGFNGSNLSYKNGSDWSKHSNSSSSPYFSAGINVHPNPNFDKIVIRGEISFTTAKFNTDATNATYSHPLLINYTFSQFTAGISLQLLYNLYSTNNFKFYAGIGFRLNKSSYSNNLYTITDVYPSGNQVTQINDYFQLRTLWYAATLQTGIILRNRIEITASYCPATFLAINEQAVLWNEYINTTRIGVNYLFRRK